MPVSRFLVLLRIVRRSLRQHALSTAVTAGSIALASGLVMAVSCLNAQVHRAFTGGPVGFDAVLGARGSQLQLVLNTVFHMETSPGNIPWSMYEEMLRDDRVSLAIPFAVGDNYEGFRIVGTTEEIFTRFEYERGRKFRFRPPVGRPFKLDKREAVFGSYAAQKTGLKVGEYFHPSHNVSKGKGEEHADRYLVTGILRPTNTPSDRVIWIPIEGIFRMEGHFLHGAGTEFRAQPGEEIPEFHKEISAVMLKFKRPQYGSAVSQQYNQYRPDATVAWPIAKVLADLFNKIGWVNRILELVSYLVAVVAAGTVLASLYNSMNERRRDLAILRALGARRRTVFSVIVLEAAVISALGSLFGFLVHAAIFAGAAAVVRAQTGVVLEVFRYHPSWVWTAAGMIALGALAGLIPARKAYATDIAANLTP